jgi:hypothetical protein
MGHPRHVELLKRAADKGFADFPLQGFGIM